MPAGRPSAYTDDLAAEFCRRMAEGRSVYSVAGDEDMPATTTVYRWMGERPEFRDKIAFAREERKELTREKIVALSDQVMADMRVDPQRVNAAINGLARAEGLMGAKTRVEHTGAGGGPIQTEEKSDLLKTAHSLALVLHAAAAKQG